jgi:hypothetical protein
MKNISMGAGLAIPLVAALVSFASLPAESQVLLPPYETPVADEDQNQPEEQIAVYRPCEVEEANDIVDLDSPNYDVTNPCAYPTPQPPVCP